MVWLLFILVVVELYHFDGSQCYGELLSVFITVNLYVLMVLHNHFMHDYIERYIMIMKHAS